MFNSRFCLYRNDRYRLPDIFRTAEVRKVALNTGCVIDGNVLVSVCIGNGFNQLKRDGNIRKSSLYISCVEHSHPAVAVNIA